MSNPNFSSKTAFKKPTYEQLTEQNAGLTALSQQLVKENGELLLKHNYSIKMSNSMYQFMYFQCGILYVAITGEVTADNPLVQVSPLAYSEDKADYILLHNRLAGFLQAIMDGKDSDIALEEWKAK